MRTTKAAILSQINQSLEIDELIIPELKLGQVLVKIAYSGVCHSQLNEIRGLKGEDKFLPHTLGHEGSGIVLEVGPEVQKVTVGEHVVLTWIKGSGLDIPATQYHRHDGAVVNSGAISTFMEYSIISENRLVPIPREMPLKEAALLGCAIPTGAGIVLNTAHVQPGQSVAVFGVGGIGLSAILAISMVNSTILNEDRNKTKISAEIIAIDVVDHKLSQARKLGATQTINATVQDPLASILEITGGRGVDYAIEAAGKKESMENAFRSVRNGGLCVLAGNLPAGHTISIDPLALIKGKKILGTWGGESLPDRDIPIYVKAFLDRKLKLSELYTQIYNLYDINQALDDLENGKINRAIIEMTIFS